MYILYMKNNMKPNMEEKEEGKDEEERKEKEAEEEQEEEGNEELTENYCDWKVYLREDFVQCYWLIVLKLWTTAILRL